jgi:glycine cleavage system pyridoxal-binding protein P
VQRDVLDRGFLVGPIIREAEGDVLLASVTERRTREEIDDLAKALEEVASE